MLIQASAKRLACSIVLGPEASMSLSLKTRIHSTSPSNVLLLSGTTRKADGYRRGFSVPVSVLQSPQHFYYLVVREDCFVNQGYAHR